MSDELQGEATGSNAQQSGDLILPEVDGTKNDYDDIGQTEQGKLHEEQAILGPEQQLNADSQSDISFVPFWFIIGDNGNDS